MVTIASAPQHLLAKNIHVQNAHNLSPVLGLKADDHKQILESKLKRLDVETLLQMQKSFYDTAQGIDPNSKASLLPSFFAMSPSQSLAANSLSPENGFASLLANEPRPQELTNSSPPKEEQKSLPKEALRANTYGAKSKTQGVFSNPTADKAAEAARQAQAQTQNFLANQLGQSFAQGNMAEFLGPNACFEDVLAMVMMNIASKSEKEMMEQIRIVEKGESGLNNFVANGARDLGGVAGGALGGYLAGATGAAIGQDVGERLVGNYTGQYGGSSRQIQFERLKMMIHKQSEMMSAISNILATIHSTNKNAISNIRG